MNQKDIEAEAAFGDSVESTIEARWLEHIRVVADEDFNELALYFLEHPSIYENEVNPGGFLCVFPEVAQRAAAYLCVEIGRFMNAPELPLYEGFFFALESLHFGLLHSPHKVPSRRASSNFATLPNRQYALLRKRLILLSNYLISRVGEQLPSGKGTSKVAQEVIEIVQALDEERRTKVLSSN